MANYRFYFIHDNLSPEGFSTEVFPLYKDFSIPRKKEENEMYYRREFNGTLTFTKEDYIYLKNWFDTESYCFELLLKIYEVCAHGTEKLEYQGIVALNDFEYDFDRCTITLNKAQTYDIYTLIDKIKDVRLNLLADPGEFTEINYGEQTLAQALELFAIGELFIDSLPTPFPGADFGSITLFSEFYQNAFNPVTALANNQFYVIQMSDFIRWDAVSPATIGELTFGQYLNWLKYTHNVYLAAEGSIIRLEHVAYYKGGVPGYSREENVSLDLTQPAYLKWIKALFRFSYDKERFPELEEWEFQNSKNPNFVGYPIKYSGACVKIGDKRRYILEGLSVDIDYINETTYVVSGDRKNDEVDFEGFVMVATPFGDTEVVTGNAPLELTYLHENFHVFNRPLPEGNMNNAPETFLSYQRQRLQAELEFPDCCNLYKSRNLIRNGNFISNSFWEDGDTSVVSSDNIDIVDGQLKFKQSEPTELPNKDFELGTGNLFDDWTLSQPSITNILKKTNDLSHSDWFKNQVTISSGGGWNMITGIVGSAFKYVYQATAALAGTHVFYFKANYVTQQFIQILLSGEGQYANFDLITGATNAYNGASSVTILQPDGSYLCAMFFTGTVSDGPFIALTDSVSAARASATTSTGAVQIKDIMLKTGVDLAPYVFTDTVSATDSTTEIIENPTGGSGGSRAMEIWDNTGGAEAINTLLFPLPGSTLVGVAITAKRGIVGVPATLKFTIDGETKTQVLTDVLTTYTFSFTTTASPGSVIGIQNDSSVNYGFMLIDDVRFFYVGTQDYNTERQDLSYLAELNTSYLLEFTISNMISGQVSVKLFETTIGSYNTNGVKTAIVNIDSAINLITDGFIKFRGVGIGYEFNIDNVKIYRYDNDIDELTLITSQIGDGEIEQLTKVSNGNFKLKLKHY